MNSTNLYSEETLLYLRDQLELGASEIFFDEALVLPNMQKSAPKIVTDSVAPPIAKAPATTNSLPPRQAAFVATPKELPEKVKLTSADAHLVIPPKEMPSDEDLLAIENSSSLEQFNDALIHHSFYRLAPGKPGRIARGSGPSECPLMLIGDWPTEEELKLGGFYAENAAELLRKLLENLNHSRNLCYATWFCKKPMLRAPLPRQVIQLRRMLLAEIRLVKPKMILLLGEATLRNVLQKNGDLYQDWGKAFELAQIPTVAIASPNEMLADPKKKLDTWNDHIPRSGLFRKKGS